MTEKIKIIIEEHDGKFIVEKADLKGCTIEESYIEFTVKNVTGLDDKEFYKLVVEFINNLT